MLKMEPNVGEMGFLREVEDYEFIARDLQGGKADLEDWLASLLAALKQQSAMADGLRRGSNLANHVEVLDAQLIASMESWSKQWSDNAPVRELMNAFGDRAILLVFGKVNAGKSSFCNFIAKRFHAYGKSVQYFFLESGRIVETDEPFQEKETEATSRIQGVRLDDRLILLDTPGLHSVTLENGDLTRRFSDGADGVLWLTSSTSPGQVQELDALCRELETSKPLLPIITRSDEFIEDEVEEQIVKVLKNKSPGNRAEQERDVNMRALDKLRAQGVNEKLLRAPLSISVWAATRDGQSAAAMEAAGFERLYAALLSLIQPALVYKRRKASEAMLHHLDENVVGSLRREVLPKMEDFQRASQGALDALDTMPSRIASEVRRGVAACLPDLLEKHKASRDVKAVCSELSALMFRELDLELRRSLKDYVVSMDASLAQINPSGKLGFEELAVEVEVKKGAAKRAAAAATLGGLGGWGGAELGATIGTTIMPGIGTIVGGVVGGIVGGVLGGMAGDKGGQSFEEAELKRQVVGVSYERLHAALEAEVHKVVPRLAKQAVEQCTDAINKMMQDVAAMRDIIYEHEKHLDVIREKLRDESI